MNAEAHQVILAHFLEKRGLSSKVIPPGLADMIYAATAPYLLMIECIDKLGSDPSNGLLIKLIDRSYETAAGSLALIAIGHLREAEILSRSVYESAATTAYIVEETPQTRLAQFFRAYVREERDQNRKWSNDLLNEPPHLQNEHVQRIQQKNVALDAYDQFIEGFIAHCGIDSDETRKWPGLIDRLTALGRRVEYRTVYAAMCSQSHHDAEDVLNYLFVNSIAGPDELADRIEREANAFSIFMVLFGLKWFVESMLAACSYLELPSVVAEGVKSLKRIADELQAVAPHLDSGAFPRNWLS